ncbi:MAG: hypothetical protein R3E01_05760 [Pirellulaceae bacterium]
MSFPLWFLQIIVIGGLVLCGTGAAALLVMLIVDSRSKKIW